MAALIVATISLLGQHNHAWLCGQVDIGTVHHVALPLRLRLDPDALPAVEKVASYVCQIPTVPHAAVLCGCDDLLQQYLLGQGLDRDCLTQLTTRDAARGLELGALIDLDEGCDLGVSGLVWVRKIAIQRMLGCDVLVNDLPGDSDADLGRLIDAPGIAPLHVGEDRLYLSVSIEYADVVHDRPS